jgi:hypothetical protein
MNRSVDEDYPKFEQYDCEHDPLKVMNFGGAYKTLQIRRKRK